MRQRVVRVTNDLDVVLRHQQAEYRARCGSSLARQQLNDRDDPSSLPGLLTKVGVLRVDAVGKIPQSLSLGFENPPAVS